MSSAARSRGAGDSGAALLMAIAFIVVVGAISGSLATLVTSSMNNRITLESVRNRQYAADGAIQDAVAGVRSLARASEPSCGEVTTLNDIAIRVDCANAYGVTPSGGGEVLAQRNVIFLACLDTGAPCTDDDVIIRAQVNFEQREDGPVTKTYVQAWSVNG